MATDIAATYFMSKHDKSDAIPLNVGAVERPNDSRPFDRSADFSANHAVPKSSSEHCRFKATTDIDCVANAVRCCRGRRGAWHRARGRAAERDKFQLEL